MSGKSPVLGVQSINPAQARIVVDAESELGLTYLTRIDRETAMVLSQVRKRLSLYSLKNCPEDIQALLAGNKNIELPKTRAPDSPFPLSWEKLQQMAGPEGPGVRYLRNKDGDLNRIETRMDGSLLVTVTKESEGFRVTIGSLLAFSAFVVSPWFSAKETDQLTDAYSRYVTDRERKGAPTAPVTIGRYRVRFELDPHIRGAFVKPSIVLGPQ